ncbi:MAG: efflux RND transporter periplasmic adaptor subunit [Verrucomicrobia bacterium]|jgi:HlyD family secretion protein|nr:efflux RND transporter periplasmic adaptor subunit [Verrucomicrobiota bacterium]MBT7067470.1 efflux RND transporter periplasmic adaptor subunit [Verrucomicrobiota bacterium]
MSKSKVILMLGVGVLCGVLVLLRSSKASHEEILLSVKQAPFQETLDTHAEVDALFYDELRAPAGRYTKQLIYLHPEGAEVNQGDLVAEFDTADLFQHIDEMTEELAVHHQLRSDREINLEAEIFAQEVMIERVTEELRIAEISKIRMMHEAEKRRSIAQSKFNNSQRTVQAAEKKLKQIEMRGKRSLGHMDRRRKVLERRIANIEKEAAKYRLYAEQNSMVVYPVIALSGEWKKVQEGDALTQNIEFCRLPQFSSKVIRVNLEEQWVNKIAEQGVVTFSPLSYPEKRFDGHILSISTLAKEGVYRSHKKFFEVIVEIDNSDQEAFDLLKPGMVCTLQFFIRDWGSVIAVPKDYVSATTAGVPYIRVRDGEEDDRIIELPDATETLDHYLLTDPALTELTLVFRGGKQ